MTATLTTPTVADAATSVACPTCEARTGDDCLSPSGRKARPHAARRDALLQAALRSQPVAQAIAVDAAGTAEVADPTPAAEPVPAGPTREELVLRLLVLKVLSARIAEADADTRNDVVGLLDVGVNLPGYLTPEDAARARRGEEDRCLGRVGLSRPSKSWKVTDPDAVLAWVQEHAPDEVEVRPTVRASFLAALVAAHKKDGGWVDPETSELHTVPGLELSLGRATLQVRPSADAADLVAEALAAGVIRADGTLAITAGD